MLYREIIAVCSQIHTKHINTLCRQNVQFVYFKLVLHIVTTGLKNVEFHKIMCWLHKFTYTTSQPITVITGKRHDPWHERCFSVQKPCLPPVPSAQTPAQLNSKLQPLPPHDLFQCLHTRLRSVRRPHPSRFACLHKTKDWYKSCVCRRGISKRFVGKLASQWGEPRTSGGSAYYVRNYSNSL